MSEIKRMKKLLYLLLFSSTITFSQTARSFLINDNDKIHHSSLTEVIAESKNYGYNLVRNDIGEYVFKDGMSEFIILKKDIDGIDDEGFPNYSAGSIWKKYLFTGTQGKETIWNIETELYLIQYPNVSTSQIKNCFSKIKNDIVKNNIKNNYTVYQTSNKLNCKSFFLGNRFYDFIEEINLRKSPETIDSKEVYVIEHIYSNGEYFERKTADLYYLTFSLKDKGMSDLLTSINVVTTNSNKAFENIRFTNGGQDMRKINQYDLEAMVKFFLEDCKKNNIKVSEIKTLDATFEPLEGNTIALSYAFGDDSLIKIKVDPEKWAKSSTEKRWYVLYHELGHDILNLEHGQGGKMMFNFADKEYTWDVFFLDKNYMINYKKTNN